MQFKYEADYNTLSVDCPPKDYIARSVPQAFRFVFDNVDNLESWKSQYNKKPGRFKTKTDKEKCMAMGLSLFNNAENAIEHFMNLKESMGLNVYSEIGNKLTKGNLTQKDGKSGAPNSGGHFTFHPSIEVDYTKFVVEIDL